MDRLEAEAGTLGQGGWQEGGLQEIEPTQRVVTRRVRKARDSVGSDDPYEVLGVKRGATLGEIRAAYLRLVKEHHPDRRLLDPESPDPDAAERLKAINAAYRKLRAGGGRGLMRGKALIFTVGVLTSLLPLVVVIGAYLAGWLDLGPRPTGTVAVAPESRGKDVGKDQGRTDTGTTFFAKDSAVGRQTAFADAKAQGTKAAWARFIADYPGGEPEAYARKAIAAIEAAEAAEARRREERLAWAAAEKGSKADLTRFLSRHPDGENAEKARAAVAAIERAERAAWVAAERAGTKEAMLAFLDRYPDAADAPEASKTLAALDAAEAKAKAEESAWADAKRADTKEAYQRFLDRHRDARQASMARAALASITETEAKEAKARAELAAAEAKAKAELASWTRAKTDGSKAALVKYLAEHPSGRHADEAKARVATLEAEEQDEEAWSLALKGSRKADYAGYLKAHPTGRRAREAKARIAELEFAETLFAVKEPVKEAKVGSMTAPNVKQPRRLAVDDNEPFIGADGRIRR